MSVSSARCMVAGANGYIGRHLSAALAKAGHDVTRSDHLPSSPQMRLWDVTHPGQIPHDLGEYHALYWMAAHSGTAISFDRAPEFMQLNLWSLAHVLNALRQLPKPPRLIFPSTRLVYKGQSNHGLKEDDLKDPLTPYGVSKLAGEQLIHAYARQYGLPYTVVRICVPYGSSVSGAHSYGTLRHFLEPARAGKDLSVYGDGLQKRSLIHIDDLARLLAECGLHEGTLNGIFNLGGPDVLSIREVADQIAAVYGVQVQTLPWPEEAFRLESGDTIFDDSRLASLVPLHFSMRFSDYIASLRNTLR